MKVVRPYQSKGPRDAVPLSSLENGATFYYYAGGRLCIKVSGGQVLEHRGRGRWVLLPVEPEDDLVYPVDAELVVKS